MKFIISSLYLFLPLILMAQISDLEKILFEMPNVIFEKCDNLTDGISYQLKIKQPLDHEDFSKGYFYQKAFLHHRSTEKPTVMVTEGYSCKKHKLYEVTELLDANQIHVEHRYFGESMPDSIMYEYLNMKQATADYHHIRVLFEDLYKGKWVSTGISKGGATSIIYKYFFPEDMDASVPYVAPINDEFEENRIYKFLDTIGTKECREKIYKVQTSILERRDEVLPLLKFYAKGAKLKYTYLDFEKAFELAVLEYPFSFWQWGSSCDEIPPPVTPTDSLLSYFLDVTGIDFFGDKSMKAYESHYYQAAAEMGYYGYETHMFEGLLKSYSPRINPHAAFTPNKMKVQFDDQLLKKLNKWLKKDGDNIIYIYGANDTWTASAVPYNETVDALWLVMKDKSHGDARIENMTPSEKQKLNTTLERWLNIKIEK